MSTKIFVIFNIKNIKKFNKKKNSKRFTTNLANEKSGAKNYKEYAKK